MSYFREFEVVGGKSDGAKVQSTTNKPQVTIELRGEKYIAIVFKHEDKDVIIYMLCGTTPKEAIAAWKERKQCNK